MKMPRLIVPFVFLAVCYFTGSAVAAQAAGIDAKALYAHHAHDSEDTNDMPFMKSESPVVTLKPVPAMIATGVPETLTFSITGDDGKPLEDLSITHERLLHVVIASKDFTIFSHIHPEDSGPVTPAMKKAAQYPVKYVFPKAGSYIVGIDFAVKDNPYSRHFEIDVSGAPKMGALKTDFSRQKKFGVYDVTLSSAPEAVSAGKEVLFSYRVMKDGTPVTDLEPYLSAYMHAAIISTDFKYFMHEHGLAPGMAEHMDHMMHMNLPEKFGPVIELHVTFPARGTYEIFGEIKHHDKVIVTSFMVEVR